MPQTAPIHGSSGRAQLADQQRKLASDLTHKADLCQRAAGSQPTDPDLALAAKNWTAAALSATQAYMTMSRSPR